MVNIERFFLLRLDMFRFLWVDMCMFEDMENFVEDGCVMWELVLIL